ncbi:response regulator transcription factor [Anaerotignum propionicum]|uniref:Stage 0 sporulation protein A homolog n=1 Tax=Anaerotignum propionicum DSM 1682 TaxID=991789 RepID=A0A0X1U734_ANAPI|nr:response regulator transcription factor [Anaerotignum propionicum]AMJ40749.1 response regulator protein GraR [Anaerotignum propionicum DSM 1682]SHF08798.1 DNA-binding response regulator, OmpR family, contains REC and winged-helix (wHTH) domain [[Clostridium] propionicum DSM 1682] [Anaerotignum propionicum DSM 1682]
MKYKILVVEDDSIISAEIQKHLIAWGFEVQTVCDFEAVFSQFAMFEPHLVILDISLPFYNGYYWCTEIRKVSKIPIIFLSSTSDNMNIIMAMNMGGDDFVAKPFDLAVLSAKVQAMIRRAYSFQGNSHILEHKGVILNLSNASLEVSGEKVELTKNELRILQILFEHKGETVSREAIMKHLWDGDCFIDDNTLAVNLTRLRKKLEGISLNDFITTKKGIGYMLED